MKESVLERRSELMLDLCCRKCGLRNQLGALPCTPAPRLGFCKTTKNENWPLLRDS